MAAGFRTTPRWTTVYHGFTRTIAGDFHSNAVFLHAVGGGSFYTYRPRRESRARAAGSGAFGGGLIGGQWVTTGVSVWAAAGGSSQTDYLFRADRDNQMQGSRFGLRFEAGAYADMGHGWSISTYGAYGVAYNSWTAEARATRRFGSYALGAEVRGLGTSASGEVHVGATAELDVFRGLALRAAVGYAATPRKGSGPYVTLANDWSF